MIASMPHNLLLGTTGKKSKAKEQERETRRHLKRLKGPALMALMQRNASMVSHTGSSIRPSHDGVVVVWVTVEEVAVVLVVVVLVDVDVVAVVPVTVVVVEVVQ